MFHNFQAISSLSHSTKTFLWNRQWNKPCSGLNKFCVPAIVYFRRHMYLLNYCYTSLEGRNVGCGSKHFHSLHVKFFVHSIRGTASPESKITASYFLLTLSQLSHKNAGAAKIWTEDRNLINALLNCSIWNCTFLILNLSRGCMTSQAAWRGFDRLRMSSCWKKFHSSWAAAISDPYGSFPQKMQLEKFQWSLHE
jgi:hypothetical protein